jgi:hypothetical protein
MELKKNWKRKFEQQPAILPQGQRAAADIYRSTSRRHNMSISFKVFCVRYTAGDGKDSLREMIIYLQTGILENGKYKI